TEPLQSAFGLGWANIVNNGVTGARREKEGTGSASRGVNWAYNAQKSQSTAPSVPVVPSCWSSQPSACATWVCMADISGMLTTVMTTLSVIAHSNHRDIRT